MMELNTRVQVRTNSQLKERATKTLDRMGIDMPTAINMFLTQIVSDQRLPFQPSITPYADAIREAESEPPIPVRDIDELMDLIDHV
ncbi:type II toxin-antitoxin system RelB/DinJ family antitoxin [Cutibacterium namnetense]|uniref:Addiction module antitoxin, RelB/DinJ family n=3 Tax=Cutibacterium namnetense TaxID=1574624 RepID=F9NUN0_9ACTN|nr:type II toxin-antitoxin system RelB/DinJ family antitoxin [Cutibacterium namnetense]EGR97242.1 addiction module antitoxin, RelB/DinJ family [ [[Propionibacterium] namnetense SK182B-JCVI]